MHDKILQQRCLIHLEHIATSALMYALDNGEQLPGTNWKQELLEYLLPNERVFSCPANKDRIFLMNCNLVEVSLDTVKFPQNTVLFFEGSSSKGTDVGDKEVLGKPLHPNGTSVAFVSGEVRAVSVGYNLLWGGD